MSFSRTARIFAVMAMFSALLVTIPVGAQVTPLVTVTASNDNTPANPVPFSRNPGEPGSTMITLTINGNNAGTVSVCVSDNGKAPVPTDISITGNGPSVTMTEKYIQSGTYTFQAYTATTGLPNPSCSGPIGAPVLVSRAGPTGKVGQDDFIFRLTDNHVNKIGDVAILPTDYMAINVNGVLTPQPDKAEFCIMSGDGMQKQVNLQIGQDPRVYTGTQGAAPGNSTVANPTNPGAGNFALTQTLNGIRAGQNGCFPANNVVVNGFYAAGIAAGPATTAAGGAGTLGQGLGSPNNFIAFCVPANAPDNTLPAPLSTSRHCAQINYQVTNANGTTSQVTGGSGLVGGGLLGGGTGGLGLGVGAPLNPSGVLTLNTGATINGAAITGADVHAIQVCAYVATPTGIVTPPVGPAVNGGTINLFGQFAQSYNGSGAVNITPLSATGADFSLGSVLLLATFDLSNGAVGANQNQPAPQVTCPTAIPTFIAAVVGTTLPGAGTVPDAVSKITVAAPAGTQLLDARFFVFVPTP